MSRVLITAPTSEAITLAEAKSHLNVSGTEDDTLIKNMVIVARNHVEDLARRALVTQTWDFITCEFTSKIKLPMSPLQSVTSVTYVDDDGASQTLATTEYDVDVNSEPGYIVEAYDKTWPSIRSVFNAVTIRFIAGYGDPVNVPEPIKQAMLLHIGHMNENREIRTDFRFFDTPMVYDSLLSFYRVHEF